MNLPHPWTRRLASSVTTIALLAAGLVATGASLAPAARAAAAAPVLRWEISQQYDDHLSNHVLGDGATEDSAGVITFPGGVGTFDPATGVASVAYQGSVRGAFAFAGSEFYHVKLEDPIVAVTADGRGQITALVSAANVSQGSTPAEETQPLRVVLTTFAAPATAWRPDGELAALTATPAWDGVLPAGSTESTAMGIPADQPVEGRSWAPTFLRQITSGVRAHFYSSGSSSDPKKAPSVFTAQATPSAPVPAGAPLTDLAWGVSAALSSAFDLTYGDGATAAGGVITFPGGVGTYDQASGVTEVAYQGSVSGSVPGPLGLSTAYTLSIEDPKLSIDATGEGVISAVVSGTTPGMLPPILAGTETTPKRVTVTTFDARATDWVVGQLTGTLSDQPDWAGVLQAGSTAATGLGIADGQPVEGKSFAAAFLAQLTEEAREHFYATASGQDSKAPARFVATAPVVLADGPTDPQEPTEPEECEPAPTSNEVDVTTDGASPAAGLTLGVVGSGFRAVSCAADAGVYVGLAPAGGLPDVSSMDNLTAFAAVDWVTPSRIVDGDFEAALNASTDKLDPDVEYAVYTWQAHTHSNTTQDTVTDVEIDWVALGLEEPAAERVPVTLTTALRAPTPRSAGRLRVVGSSTGAADAPSGRLTLVLQSRGAAKTTLRRSMRDGRAVFPLPAAAPGRWTATLTYAGTATYRPARRSVAYRVRASSRQAAQPAVVATTKQQARDGLVVSVSGTGFTAVTNSGDAGVYVGLAPAGGMPDVSTREGMDAFAASQWIQPGQMPDGTFTTSLVVSDPSTLADVEYALYTWQAHTHSNTTQDTETALPLDRAALAKGLSTTSTELAKKPTPTKAGALSVSVSGRYDTPTGAVRVVLSKGSATRTLTGTLRSGTAKVKLPKLAKGTWRVTVSYGGSDAYHASSATSSFRV